MRRRGSTEKGTETGTGTGSGIENRGRDTGTGTVSEIMTKVEGEETGIIRKGNGTGIGEGTETVIADILARDHHPRLRLLPPLDTIPAGDLDLLTTEPVLLIIESEK